VSASDDLDLRTEADYASSADSLTDAARKRLNRATLALDDALAVIADGDTPDPRDIERAARAVQAARSLLREVKRWIQPAAKATARRQAHAVRMKAAN